MTDAQAADRPEGAFGHAAMGGEKGIERHKAEALCAQEGGML